jgi:phosphoglycerate kinase
MSALVDSVDSVIVGGAMGLAFLAATGNPTGRQTFDHATLDRCRELLDRCGDRILLPDDFVVAHGDSSAVVTVNELDDRILTGDIGPRSVARFGESIERAASVLWNGPVGIYEDPRFTAGTRELATAIVRRPVSVVGGGDTIAAIRRNAPIAWGELTHASTGGGALLALLRGEPPIGLGSLAQCSHLSHTGHRR